MTTPMGSLPRPKNVSTTSNVNEKTAKKNPSPFKENTHQIENIRSESIETGEHQNSKFKTNAKKPINAKAMKQIQRSNSEWNLNVSKDHCFTAKEALPFQFKMPQELPPSNKRKRDETSFESPIAIHKVAHTENTQHLSKLSASERNYDLEQPTFEELNTKFNSDLVHKIFLNLTPESKINDRIENKLEIKNNEPVLKVESTPQEQELSPAVQAALKVLMKRETTLEEMCCQFRVLTNEGKLEEFVHELDVVKLEKLWSFESKMLIGRTEIEARNTRLTNIFSLLSEGQLKTSLNMLNFVTIIGDTINGSSKAAAEGFSPEMLEIIAAESTSFEKVHSLGNVIASFEVHDTPKLKRNLTAVSNVHALGVVDSIEKIKRKAKLEKLSDSFNLKSMQVSPTSRNILNNKIKIAVTPQKKNVTTQSINK